MRTTDGTTKLRYPPRCDDSELRIKVPVKTSAGDDAAISIEVLWLPDEATGKLDEIPTWSACQE